MKIYINSKYYLLFTIFNCCILTFNPAKNAIQTHAPEGGDTF